MTTESSTSQSISTKTANATSTEASKSRTTESSEQQSSNEQSAQPQASTNTAQASQPVTHVLWDASKSAERATFMQSWGQEMGQQYRSYDDHVQANYYGLQVPQDILMVNGQPSLIKRQSRWSGQKMVRDKLIFRLWQSIRTSTMLHQLEGISISLASSKSSQKF